MSSRCLECVLAKQFFFFQDVLQDVFKTSSRRLRKTSSRTTSWRRLGRQKIITLKTCWRRLQERSWRHLQDVLKTSKYSLGNMIKTKIIKSLILNIAASCFIKFQRAKEIVSVWKCVFDFCFSFYISSLSTKLNYIR